MDDSLISQYDNAHVRLRCVKQNSKLRVRPYAIILQDGTEILGSVFDSTLNCQFPRSLRKEGREFIVPIENITMKNATARPYYHVRETGLKIVDVDLGDADTVVDVEQSSDVTHLISNKSKAAVKNSKKDKLEKKLIPVNHSQKSKPVFDNVDCIICFSESTENLLFQCGHKCCCASCVESLIKTAWGKAKCPLCRTVIQR